MRVPWIERQMEDMQQIIIIVTELIAIFDDSVEFVSFEQSALKFIEANISLYFVYAFCGFLLPSHSKNFYDLSTRFSIWVGVIKYGVCSMSNS